MEGVKEVHYGRLEGCVIKGPEAEPWVETELNRLISDWSRGIDSGPPDGETPTMVSKRGLAAIEEIKQEMLANSYENVLVICHGRFLRIIFSTLLRGDIKHMAEMEQANASVSVLEFRTATTQGRKEEKVELLKLNSTGHLDDLSCL